MAVVGCPLNISQTITGDCQNNSSGGFNLYILGASPYLLEWISPNANPVTSVQYETIEGGTYQINGIPSGSYTISITDSCAVPSSQKQTLVITITSATCVTIQSENTICGLNNGSLTATTSSWYGQGSFDVYKDGFYLTGTTGATNGVIFTDLPAGLYYVIASDVGGCTGKSENCVIMSSSTLQYGLYVVNDGNCTGRLNEGTGKIFVTGLTGNGPFTYLWSDTNKSTTPYITGLTEGSYGVTITDSLGCVVNQTAVVEYVPNMGLVSTLTSPPTCYGNDGEITLFISGGTAPYYYLNNNTGEVQISFQQTVTFSNLAPNNYSFTITDAGLCTFNPTVTLIVPNIFNVLSVNTKNPTCQSSNGSISILLNGGTPPYTYKLINSQNFEVNSVTSLSANQVFTNLSGDTYQLQITDNTNSCNYLETILLNSNASFSLSTSVEQPTCGNNNGSITVTKTDGGTGPFVYSLNNIYFSPSVVGNSFTFPNIPTGFYTARVIDSTGCTQFTTTTVNSSNNIQFFLSKTDVVFSNDGTINTYITNGVPPFNITWSENVNGQTGLNLNSLSAGTYSVTITDSSGCTQTSEVNILGPNLVSDYQIFNICSGTITDEGIVKKDGLKEMLADGYFELASTNTSCILNNAVMTAIVNVGDTQVTQEFYTSSSLSDVPSDSLWVSTISDMIKSVYGVGDVIVDVENNTIRITTDCNLSENVLSNAEVSVDLKIDYDIKCISCIPVYQVFTACCDGSYWLVPSRLGNFEVGDTVYTTGGCMSFVVVNPDDVEISGIILDTFFENSEYNNCSDCLTANGACSATPTPTPTVTPTITPSVTITQTPTNTQTPTVTPTNTPTTGLSPTPTPTQTTTPTNTQTPGLSPTPTPTKTVTPTKPSPLLYSFSTGSYACVSGVIQFTTLNTANFYVAPTTNIYNTSVPFQMYINSALTSAFTVSAMNAPLYMRIGNNIWSVSQTGVATYLTQVGSSCIFA